ncbi:amino acid transporter [Nocardioides sp.]|uniref:amino acid transporter n=1 Tax=Nocardioides sp. TaxID=35761 RepID=UPI00286CB8EE|nr:amino acid transporter [Nocardioides sp.]
MTTPTTDQGRAFRGWFLHSDQPEPSGFYEDESVASEQAHVKPWWKVMCLTGVDYFSTLGYQPGIAALAAGALAPIATLVLVLVTLFGALPMYRRVAAESPHGDGSLSMLERLLSYWPSKLLVLALIGFVATGFVITITLSAADASAHLVENPFLHDAIAGKEVLVTLGLLALLAAVFLKGFTEAIGIAVVLVAAYLGLSAVVIVDGFRQAFAEPSVFGDWTSAISEAHASPLAVIGASLLVFPALALGLSGFETGVVVMPLVKGDPGDTRRAPLGRIRNARKLLTAAALIMSVLLLGSSLVTTLLIPTEAFEPGGEANGRALAFLAHESFGDGFGTLYDAATIGILWFAGASAMAGLLNIVPRFLPRYGMVPDWARATRPLVLVFTVIAAVVTILFKADVDAQAGAYATGVLALMTSAAVAVTLTEWRRGHRRAGAFFGVVTAVFVYTITVTVVDRPEGLLIAMVFIAMILVISVVSRISRSTELRVARVELDPAATAVLEAAVGGQQPVRFIANKLDAGDDEEYAAKSLDVRLDNHLRSDQDAVFLEVSITDASEFTSVVPVTAVRVGGHDVLRATGTSVPNVLAAVLLAVRDRAPEPPHVYFEWSERGPGENALRFLFAGGGDIPPLTREVLRRAEPDADRRPMVHAGG